jgi:cell division protein FtsZ
MEGKDMVEFEDVSDKGAKIRVLGIGGGGGNAINTMIELGLTGVDFIAANTDVQALWANKAPTKIQLGEKLTGGLGAGGVPEVGRDAALEHRDRVKEELQGADMVFITAGMGGGTGTGAAPILAGVARETGALTIGVVTKPFLFEGRHRMRLAEEGIAQLRKEVDALITIPNQRLLNVFGNNQWLDSFRMADEVLFHAVKGISDIITVKGYINVDFADVRTIMKDMGMAVMGQGVAKGDTRAVEAASRAISSPLLEDISMEGARGLLINITAGRDLRLQEVEEALNYIQESVHEDANVILGAVLDETIEDEIRITVIATGFGRSDKASINPKVVAFPAGPFAEVNSPFAENFEVPAYKRHKKELDTLRSIRAGGVSFRAVEEQDYDIPTFLRQPAD